MELKAVLKKPYTEEQKIDFIIKQNHILGYELKETEIELQALGYTEDEMAIQERARINMLMLTGADVERAIYKNCGMDFEDVVALLETKYADVIDVKAVKIELKANNFYRGNPYVVQIGTLLGYSSDDMDYLFEHKELPTKEDEGTVKDDLTVGEDTEETSVIDEE